MYRSIRNFAFRAWGSWNLLQRGKPKLGFGFLGSIGDELLTTAAYIEWQKRCPEKIWVMTRNPDFFKNLAPASCILPENLRYARICHDHGIPFHFLSYSRTPLDSDQDTPLTRPLIAEICSNAGLDGTITLRPYIFLSGSEISRVTVPKNAIVVQSSSLSAKIPMRNKQWPVERMQTVVTFLRRQKHTVLQIGLPSEPLLEDVVDLRGKTSLRETAAVLQQSRLFIGLVGFQMHLARAVDCPSVIIYGGRETPALTGYSCNSNVTNSPSCSPCWLRSSCSFRNQCMNDIGVSTVTAAVEQKLAEARSPLSEDTWRL